MFKMRSRSRARAGATLAEWAPSLVVLLLIVLPAINLIGLACGAATVFLAALQCSSRASVSTSLNNAIDAITAESTSVIESSMGKFSKLRPVGGVNNCGADLYINATDVFSSKTVVYGPNSPLPVVDTAANVYELAVKTCFLVGPIIDMSGVPLMKDVPGVGRAAAITCSWHRVLERAPLFAKSKILAQGASPGDFASPPGQQGSQGADGADLEGWDYPSAGTSFKPMPGEEILDQKDLTVLASNPQWTNTGIKVEEGNRLSFDFLADGTWTGANGMHPGDLWPPSDADGYTSGTLTFDGMPFGALIGKVGENGTTFNIGKDLYNFTPPGTGMLFLIFNDDLANPSYSYEDNSGQQDVRVYLTN